MRRLAFFWKGEDTAVPAALVQSARLVYGGTLPIVQLSDRRTPAIAGVTDVLRGDFSEHVMVGRLDAYSRLGDGPMTVYADADCMLLAPLRLPPLGAARAHLVMRENGMEEVNHLFRGPFPEFAGKTFGQVMPILAALIAVEDGASFFAGLRDLCLALPERFHRWYGDQVALAEIYRRNPASFSLLPARSFLRSIDDPLSEQDLRKLISIGTRMIHFKGKRSKALAAPALDNLRRVLPESAGSGEPA
ncbi:MAG TPA: hypothetical protein VHA55_08015 [Pseudorhodoplanes sp.]|nr:hypothetical protein [Pseudorhodoplanes sp.]